MQPGSRIGKYQIESLLGEGGNGTVYAAHDSVLGRRVALKLLRRELMGDPNVAGRFRQEAQAMAQLNHPNVVIVHDFVGEASPGSAPVWAIVMELVEHGETLASIIRRERRIPALRAVRLFAQVAAGLGHAHQRGVVHRDVKPANVLVLHDGAREIAKVTDFGIARLLQGERRTNAQLTLGTLWYIAPEQAQNSAVDARADVYALGASLYEALTGRVVFPYDNVARVLAAHIGEAPIPASGLVPGLPDELDRLVLRCLAKRPEDRPEDGAALASLLAELEPRLDPTRVSASAPQRSVPPTQAMHMSTLASAPTALHALAPHARSVPPTHVHGAGAHTPPAMHTPREMPFATTPQPPAALASTPSPRSASARASDNKIGLWVGFGTLALITLACLFGSFLCVITGIIRS